MTSHCKIAFLTLTLWPMVAACESRVSGAQSKPVALARATVAASPVRLTSLLVEPKQISLNHSRDLRSVVVTARYSDDSAQDVTGKAKFVIADAKLATIDKQAIISPLADGTTTLTATFEGKATTIPVEVRGAKREIAWDFTTQVAPLFTKYGCNGSNCHGSPVGKPSTENNFKLSLFGDDPSIDFEQVNKDFKANKPRERVNVKSPDESLLIKKPTAQVPHGGGMRFAKDSATAKLLRDWIAAGAPKGAVYAPELSYLGSTLADIEVYPKERVFNKKGDQQRFVVLAKFENGQTEDITHRARFTLADDEIAKSSEDGIVTAHKDGETVVMVKYLSFIKAPRIMVVTRALPSPLLPSPASKRGSSKEILAGGRGAGGEGRPEGREGRNNYIDDIVNRKFKKIRVIPSSLAGDDEFVRRVYLDLIGQLPTIEEARSFLADKDSAKREKLIDALLDRPEYVDFWTVRWGDILRNDRRFVTVKGMWTFHDWIRDGVASNKPWDQFVREIILAQGSTYKNGPANFYRVLKPIEERTSAMAQAFLGVRIECARCHNHPFDRWTNDDYHGLAAFFARVAIKNGEMIDNTGQLQEEIVVVNRQGDHTRQVPNKPNQVMNPKLLEGKPMPREGEADRRVVLADWLTSRENKPFARALVNRLWGHFMGRGIVDPVDDFRVSNPPINEELLEALRADLVAHNFDVKYMIKAICSSRTYQLTWKPNETNANENQNFSRHYVQRLSAEQLLDAVNQVTGVPEKFPELPLGTKAIQLPDTSNMGYFLDIFGKPRRTLVCECERNPFGNMSQALHLINSPTIQNKIQSPQGRVAKMIAAGLTDLEMIDELYLAALQRKPKPNELKEALDNIDHATTRQEGVEDVLWALINSREFMFNH